MHIKRALLNQVIDKLQRFNKVVIIYGPRQIGKTTLAQHIIKKLALKTLSIDADKQPKEAKILSQQYFSRLEELVTGYELLFIDEAQRIPNIGLTLKILHDHMPQLKILVTGSSSFELATKVSEPLTGRHWSYILYPIALLELKDTHNPFELQQLLENQLLYGSYPEIFSIKNSNEKQEFLQRITSSYLYKDILELSNVKHATKILNLLQLIAYQTGSLVSTNELSRSLEISRSAVERYIDLLEKSFVLKRLTGFSRNLRKEITKNDKIYFYDLGIRNAIIDNFKPLSSRNDVGELWENFIIMERFKKNAYTHHFTSSYFWRTYTGAEIDYVEEHSGKQFGFEIKWKNRKVSAPKTWLKTYKDASWQAITKDNYLNFVA